MKNLFLALLFASVAGVSSGSAKNITIANDTIVDILQSIPSPLEISLLLKQVSKDYNLAALSNSNSVGNYATDYSQAINLGIYSTDLGYANLYGRNQDVLNYLNGIKKLADNLKIGQFFNYDEIKKLAQTSNNLNKLMEVSQRNFETINDHLNNQKREYLSALILTGGWIEALHLTAQAHIKTKNAALKEKLAEQKIVLPLLLKVLNSYKTRPNFAGLINDLKEIEAIYARATINSTKNGKGAKGGKDTGKMEFSGNATSTAVMSNDDVQMLGSLVASIRSKMMRAN